MWRCGRDAWSWCVEGDRAGTGRVARCRSRRRPVIAGGGPGCGPTGGGGEGGAPAGRRRGRRSRRWLRAWRGRRRDRRGWRRVHGGGGGEGGPAKLAKLASKLVPLREGETASPSPSPGTGRPIGEDGARADVRRQPDLRRRGERGRACRGTVDRGRLRDTRPGPLRPSREGSRKAARTPLAPKGRAVRRRAQRRNARRGGVERQRCSVTSGLPRAEPDAMVPAAAAVSNITSGSERSGAGVEPTEPWAARPHSF